MKFLTLVIPKLEFIPEFLNRSHAYSFIHSKVLERVPKFKNRSCVCEHDHSRLVIYRHLASWESFVIPVLVLAIILVPNMKCLSLIVSFSNRDRSKNFMRSLVTIIIYYYWSDRNRSTYSIWKSWIFLQFWIGLLVEYSRNVMDFDYSSGHIAIESKKSCITFRGSLVIIHLMNKD